MPAFDEIVQQLQERRPLPPLYPTQPWNNTLSQQIKMSSAADFLGPEASAAASDKVAACRAGLLLWNDDLEASHSISQGLENATGSFWHAIMHRREGDAANSHYWWRRTGAHPAFADVYENVLAALQGEPAPEVAKPEVAEFVQALQRAATWVPMEFVGRCEMARRGQLQSDWLQQVQVIEISTLLRWCRAQL
ncbi:MAG: hypothetical protein JO316_22780 [Abitibacteriaceae bacterium]|nr:hypothetical protein [Abditibacteriaceae bacterium]MBV9868189.1 hypothetical protein [Abditibacteriaceae bacterium]